MPLDPRAYYSGQSPMQARALGTEIGARERQLADQQAQMQGRMAAGGFADPQSYYKSQEETRMATAQHQAMIQGFTEVADIMDGANEMHEMGYESDVSEYLKSAWDNVPSMQRLFPEGAPSLNKREGMIVSDPFVAGENFPGMVVEPDKTSHDRGITKGQTYVSETVGDATKFRRVPGTQELGAKGRAETGGTPSDERRMKRISIIGGVIDKLQRTGGLDPFEMWGLQQAGMDIPDNDPEKAIKILEREKKVLESKLPESYRMKKEVSPKPIPDLDALLKEVM